MVTATQAKPYREITPEGRYILNLHAGQTKAWDSRARFIVISAGSQGGKTCFEPDWLRREIKNCGEGDYIVVTATFPLLELKLLPEFRYVFETAFHLGEYLDSKKTLQFHHVPGGTDGHVKVIDNTRIIFGSATHPESLESATAKAAVLDEAGQKQFKLETWEAVQRRLSLSEGRALFGTTLYNSGWFVTDVYTPAMKREGGLELVQFDSITNPSFPAGEYERARATLPAWKFAMFYQGKFIRPAGLVYDCFDVNTDAVQRFEIPRSWHIYTGHDFGTANPAAMFYAKDPDTGIYYAFAEYLPGAGHSTYNHVEAFKQITRNTEQDIKLGRNYNVVMRVGGNLTTEDGWRNDFGQHGWPIQPPKETMRRVENQIAQVYAHHKLHKIKVFSDLHHYLDEKMSFSYELDERYNPTDKYEDEQRYHLMASERTLFSSFTPETASANKQQIIPSPYRF